MDYLEKGRPLLGTYYFNLMGSLYGFLKENHSQLGEEKLLFLMAAIVSEFSNCFYISTIFPGNGVNVIWKIATNLTWRKWLKKKAEKLLLILPKNLCFIFVRFLIRDLYQSSYSKQSLKMKLNFFPWTHENYQYAHRTNRLLKDRPSIETRFLSKVPQGSVLNPLLYRLFTSVPNNNPITIKMN